MKKKTKKSTKRKQKIDVVIESLLNLEQKVKELIKKVEQLQYSQPYYPNPNLPAPQSPQQPSQPNPWFKPAWPNTDQPIVWENTSTMSKKDSNWEAIENGWQ
jgi:hypothetical protein